MARIRVSKKGLIPSSTSKMLKGLNFRKKTISHVMKQPDSGTRFVHFTDKSKLRMSKEDVKSLAHIQGGMTGANLSKSLTPWERRARMARGMKIKEAWLAKDRAGFIKQRNRTAELVKHVEGVPKIKFVKRRGVNIPVIAHYYSTHQPATKDLITRVKRDMGRIAAFKLKYKLRKMSPSAAMKELLAEHSIKKKGIKMSIIEVGSKIASRIAKKIKSIKFNRIRVTSKSRTPKGI
jgi:hypothetical protein